ncbi:protein translocase subunit SecF [Patescibacteria group bacterium]|nr:protein translocase subunit SecF [Patescibacteria group bacterium]
MRNFLKYKTLYFFISALFLVPGIIALFLWGFNPSIDFTGGTLWQIEFAPEFENSADEIKAFLEESGHTVHTVQSLDGKSFLLKLSPLDETQKEEIKTGLSEKFTVFAEKSFETVGPVLGQELLEKTIMAIVLTAGFIMLYVAWRFKNKMYGICAILAMFHDTFILLGAFSLLGHFYGVEVDTLFVTAVLMMLSFSVHDTVVVYDRIRELKRIHHKESFENVVNQAIGDTIVRSINNSLTLIFMLLALLFLGGETIRWFVVALLVGTIAGTYSSTFTAAPLLVVWYNRAKK